MLYENVGKTHFHLSYTLVGIALLLCLWELLIFLLVDETSESQLRCFSPLPTLQTLLSLFADPKFWHSTLASLRRICIGTAIAFAIGYPLGIAIGYSKAIRAASGVPIHFLRMISPLAWMPIALLVFGNFEHAIYFLLVITMLWPMALNVSFAISRIKTEWLQMARNQGATEMQLIAKVIIPASLPCIASSLRLAIGLAWIILVPAEMFGVSSGLGYLINDARDTLEYEKLSALAIAIGLFGFMIDRVISAFYAFFLKRG